MIANCAKRPIGLLLLLLFMLWFFFTPLGRSITYISNQNDIFCLTKSWCLSWLPINVIVQIRDTKRIHLANKTIFVAFKIFFLSVFKLNQEIFHQLNQNISTSKPNHCVIRWWFIDNCSRDVSPMNIIFAFDLFEAPQLEMASTCRWGWSLSDKKKIVPKIMTEHIWHLPLQFLMFLLMMMSSFSVLFMILFA